LVKNTIIYSDNTAYDLLVLNTDNQNFKKTFTDLGILLPPAQEVNLKDFITVKDYSSFFRVLYNASYLSPENSQKALNLLTQTTFKDGLTALLPSDLTVAHKFGERLTPETGEVQLHDCGIVYYPQNPYLLCLMTRGRDPKKLAKFIGQTSLQIYDYLRAHPAQ